MIFRAVANCIIRAELGALITHLVVGISMREREQEPRPLP